jgi:hypothetical protein
VGQFACAVSHDEAIESQHSRALSDLLRNDFYRTHVERAAFYLMFETCTRDRATTPFGANAITAPLPIWEKLFSRQVVGSANGSTLEEFNTYA